MAPLVARSHRPDYILRPDPVWPAERVVQQLGVDETERVAQSRALDERIRQGSHAAELGATVDHRLEDYVSMAAICARW